MKKKVLVTALAALMLAASFTACATKPAASSVPAAASSEAATASSEAAAVGSEVRIGQVELNEIEKSSIVSLLNGQNLPLKNVPLKMENFPTLNALLLELKAGRIASALLPASVCNYLAASDDTIKVATAKMTSHFHMGTRSADTALNTEISTAIDEMKKDGTMKTLADKYIVTTTDPETNVLTKKEGAETYTVAVTGDFPPLDYVAADGTPAGFNIALLNTISEKINCNFEIVQVEAPARLSALESEKVDIVFWLDCYEKGDHSTEQNNLLFTSSYYEELVGIVFYGESPVDALHGVGDKILK